MHAQLARTSCDIILILPFGMTEMNHMLYLRIKAFQSCRQVAGTECRPYPKNALSFCLCFDNLCDVHRLGCKPSWKLNAHNFCLFLFYEGDNLVQLKLILALDP